MPTKSPNTMRQLKITTSITIRGDKSLDLYLQEIGKEELISAEEEVILAQQIKQGDEKALEKLVKANVRFVVSVAKQYQNQGLSLPDLINDGNLGLIKAAQRFDETRGFKFISYAVWWIRQSILQGLAEDARVVRLPLNQIGSINKMKKTFSKLEQKFEREPTAEEMAEMLGIPEYKMEDTLRYYLRQISVDSPSPFGDESDGENNLLGSLHSSDPKEKTDASLISDDLKMEISRSLETLEMREAEILRLYFGINKTHSHTLEEIGEKFDLTRERVRQVKEKALRKLKHPKRSKILKTYLG